MDLGAALTNQDVASQNEMCIRDRYGYYTSIQYSNAAFATVLSYTCLLYTSIVVIGNGVGGQEGVDAEVFRTHGLELLIALDNLFLGEAVLGLAGVVHDLEALFALTQGKDAAGIVAAGDGLGDVADCLLQEVDVGEVIQVDDGVLLVRLNVLFRRDVYKRQPLRWLGPVLDLVFWLCCTITFFLWSVDSVGAVSYTHLDVYKRQLSERP